MKGSEAQKQWLYELYKCCDLTEKVYLVSILIYLYINNKINQTLICIDNFLISLMTQNKNFENAADNIYPEILLLKVGMKSLVVNKLVDDVIRTLQCILYLHPTYT